MMLKKQLLILLLLFIGTMNVFSQLRTVGTDSERKAEYKKAIGLDTTIPDFNTNKIDAQVMGSRLANLLNYLLENYHQESYELQLAQILSKQNENLQHLYYKIKKMQFANASKQGDVIAVTMNVWPDKNQADVNQADLIFRFVDGASDDQTTNALFSYMSRYVEAQEMLGGGLDDSDAIVTNSFWDNWYGQFGVDMSLLNAYGSNFLKNVFPNGKSFGVNAALGKWFTPDISVRGSFKWENGIFKNDHATWLGDANPDKGGYITLTADVLFNIHNIFKEYDKHRKWNLSLYPKLGALINLGSKEGSPLLGLGIVNTYRITDRWSIFGDVAYHATSSALGIGTGRGSGSNGFFDIKIGAQLDLGNNKFQKSTEYSKDPYCNQYSVCTNSLWDNWCVQVGVGMSLLNVYGSNFMNVFPNGKTLGINLGIGKWFSPEIGLRGGFNWQNGIVGNYHLTWMDQKDQPGSNHKAGGYAALNLDVFLNLHNTFSGYDNKRTWNSIVYPRAGIVYNFDLDGGSPVIGLGTEQTFKLNDRLRLFADIVYQFSTSELVPDEYNTNTNDGSHGSSNGWFDINVGLQYEIGKYWWDKPGEKPLRQAQGPHSHNWPRFIVNTGASVAVAFGAKTVLKAMIKEERPDHSDNKSFPSGHASMAFAVARSIDKEFRKDCIWVPIAGYAAATAIGVERVVNKHHYWYDVVAGAAIGIGSAELTWWLSNLCFGKGSNVAVGSSVNTVDVVYIF